MKPIGHVMILASAGSGKTFALTNRFVRLLALGAKPERIVALTFTRKAAGEFFDEILNKLARAAAEPVEARTLAEAIELPALQPADFLKMLRAVVDAMHRLRLGTLDGFFARIARNFPLELGLAGDFEVLQAHGAQMERSRVLRRMFERTGELATAQREFIEAFKRATFGTDEKRLGAQLDAFLDRHQEIFLSAPAAAKWGNAERIWPKGADWFETKPDTTAALQTLRAWTEFATLGDKQRLRWQAFIEACGAWSPGGELPDPLEYVLKKALDAWSGLTAGRAVLEFDRKKQELSEVAGMALAEITRHIVGEELRRRLEMTRGIHAVLAGYEAIYHDAVRRAGKLTFGDVQRLLEPAAGAPVLSSGEDGDDGRLLIDYRLDGEIDHWLLDEFQDTSHGQWSVLRNLVDEAVQDPTGARSFFYVGDVKQAIFAWREGDPRLFREIFNHYNATQPGTIAEKHLVESWRSGLPVIEAVNEVFGAAAVLRELFPGAATQAWNAEWKKHESAKPQLGGHVALLHGEDEDARFAITLGVLQEIEPLARGLSCAVLVQDNATAARLADYLRREGSLPAVAESDLHVCVDNPLGAALLALVKAAAHPGDTLAQEHVRMTPLGRLLVVDGIVNPDDLTRRILGQIHAEGFERTMAEWARRLLPALAADDAFTRERARQFIAAARLFDETGSRDVAEFLAFMERYTTRETDPPEVVRVMTIHKSKGLGFDVVVLPDLEGTRIDCRREGLAVQKSAERDVAWVLDLPTKIFHQADPVLAEHVRAAEASACYESLSLLYVAMTRAKRGMYLVTKIPGATKSRNFPKLLASTLGEETMPVRVGGREFAGAFFAGDADWFAEIKSVTPSPAAARIPRMEVETGRTRRLMARRPSEGKAAELGGAQLFSLQRGAAADFGTDVHRLLAEVKWVTQDQLETLGAEWKTRGVPAAVGEEVLACLTDPALARVWRYPMNVVKAEVWRERPFEVALDGTWITGVFDRVVVERDPAGRALRATVIDFKTGARGEGETSAWVAGHAAQLNLYRRVVAILTGVASAEVGCLLVSTKLRRLVEVPAEPRTL